MTILIEGVPEDALVTATRAHSGQFRRGGAPYISHPARVAQHVQRVKGDSHKADDLIAAAYLHDTLEDTDMTEKQILDQFGPNVLNLVFELTSDEEELKRLGKTAYLQKKFSGISSWALVIKLSDRLDNVSDLLDADYDWALKYAKQTQDILIYLIEHRKLTSTQKRLVGEIQEILDEFYKK